MPTSNFYAEATPYEFFIRRAHNCFRQNRHGADQSFMQNLMLAEVNSPHVRRIGSYNKQLEKVKGYMAKALDKFLKSKISADNKRVVAKLAERLENTDTTAGLMQIVEEGLESTRSLKES